MRGPGAHGAQGKTFGLAFALGRDHIDTGQFAPAQHGGGGHHQALAIGLGVAAHETHPGLAAWHLANGRRDAAVPLLREIVDGVPQQWPAFGYVAAEAELARLARTGG